MRACSRLGCLYLLVGRPQLAGGGDGSEQARQLRLALGQVQVGAADAVVHQLAGGLADDCSASQRLERFQ